MGKPTKGFLLLIALFAGALGAWIVALPILGWLILPSLLRGKNHGSSPSFWLNALGVILVLLGLFAIYGGGTYSPVVFLTGGSVILLRHRLRVGIASKTYPVGNSILLRSPANPFHWIGVVEVKVATRDIEGALSGLKERILIVSNPTPRIFLIFSTDSWRQSGAESDIVARIRSVTRALIPLGIYLLPLDGIAAVAATRIDSVQSRLPKEDITKIVSSLDYGAAAIEVRHAYVSSVELYKRPDGSMKATSLLSGRKEAPRGSITAGEFLREAFQKIGAPRPDGYAAFLASMAATEGETLGQRLIQTERQGGNVLLVASAGASQVKLTDTQLRAIAEIYE